MKKYGLTTLLILLLLAFLGSLAADTKTTKGIICFREDLEQKPLEVSEFRFIEYGNHTETEIVFSFEGTPITLPLSQLKELRILSTSGSRATVILTTRTGKQLHVQKARMNSPYDGTAGNDLWTTNICYEYRFTNPLTEQIETRYGSVSWERVSRIIFDEGLGNFKCCPHCKGFFHRDYHFCPFDQTELVWTEFEE